MMSISKLTNFKLNTQIMNGMKLYKLYKNIIFSYKRSNNTKLFSIKNSATSPFWILLFFIINSLRV
jgi:hypothetical protein